MNEAYQKAETLCRLVSIADAILNPPLEIHLDKYIEMAMNDGEQLFLWNMGHDVDLAVDVVYRTLKQHTPLVFALTERKVFEDRKQQMRDPRQECFRDN